MPPIMISSNKYFTNSIGKAYLAAIMGLFMVLVEVGMHDHQYSVMSTYTYLWVIVLLAVFIYLYRKQIGINDKQYLEGMIEHHSMALLTSEEILNKTDDYNIAKLAKNIIQTQTDEIKEMEDLLRKK
jgi:Ca2+/Na+ antiporter